MDGTLRKAIIWQLVLKESLGGGITPGKIMSGKKKKKKKKTKGGKGNLDMKNSKEKAWKLESVHYL